MMAMESDSRSASSMKCVVSSMALPFLYLDKIVQSALLDEGSTPLVGSSGEKWKAFQITCSHLSILVGESYCSYKNSRQQADCAD